MKVSERERERERKSERISQINAQNVPLPHAVLNGQHRLSSALRLRDANTLSPVSPCVPLPTRGKAINPSVLRSLFLPLLLLLLLAGDTCKHCVHPLLLISLLPQNPRHGSSFSFPIFSFMLWVFAVSVLLLYYSYSIYYANFFVPDLFSFFIIVCIFCYFHN